MKNKYNIGILIIVILALICRLVYVIKTPYYEKQHDVGTVGDGAGGLDYIFTIYETGKLPQDNYWQHYHPPLHQIISATWLRIISFFNQDTEFMCESLQFVTLIYSMILILIVYKILEELYIENKYKILAMIVMAFHPTLIILSGSINNDGLCLLLMAWALLRLIKWYKNDNIKNTASLAITTGLCVMAKTSGAIIAIPIIYIFLLRLYQKMKNSENKVMVFKKYMWLFIFFGAISLPIGLWYPIRNYIRFNQPILYVMDPQNPEIYVGDFSLWQRFFPLLSEIAQMYCNTALQHNIPVFLLKCSLFGEWTWGTSDMFKVIYVLALFMNIYLIIQTIYYSIMQFKQKTKYKIWAIAFMTLSIFNFVSFIMMNIKLPYGCSMDFRYLTITLFTGLMFVIFGIESTKDEKRKKIKYKMILESTIILCALSDFILIFS